jgi:hypothetical protein
MSIIYTHGRIQFQVSDYTTDVGLFATETMADYDKTFNIFMGTSNKTLDWFDN